MDSEKAMKDKEVSPAVVVGAIIAVLAVIVWFVWHAGLIATPVEQHPHNGGPSGEIRMRQQPQQQGGGTQSPH